MKRNNMLKLSCFGLLVVSWIATGYADDSAKRDAQPKSHKQLLASVESLHAKDVPWRKIPWKACLLDGIRESRKQHKPIILWVFIDRPIDDERC
jgi:hypothetical protein